MLKSPRILLVSLFFVSVVAGSSVARAQTVILTDSFDAASSEAVEVNVEVPPGVILNPASPQSPQSFPAQPAPMGTTPSAAAQPGQPGAANAGQKPDDKKEKPEPNFIVRPEKPDKPADPRELLIQPGTDGKMSLNFGGQT